MSIAHQLARRGRLSDRLVRPLVRRLAIRRLQPAEAAASEAPERRLGAVLGPAAVPGLWRPGEPPVAHPDGDLATPVIGHRGLEAAAHWPRWAKDLDAAEEEMLGLITRRARIEARHSVLLVARRRAAAAPYLAEETERAPVVWTPRPEDAETIRARAEGIGLGHLDLRSGPIERATPPDSFDRVLVIESVPAAADPRVFLTSLGGRLRPGGRLFLQLACHRRYAYRLSGAEGRWLGLAAGSLVPATDLAPRLAPELTLAHHWELSGEHYERTCRAWRRRLEAARPRLLVAAARWLGETSARRAVDDWRLALLAREAMFGARGGQEWWISHYLLERPRR